MSENDQSHILDQSLYRVLQHARIRDYAGYSKFDALNSPLIERLCGWNRLLSIAAVQTVNRTPFRLRELFGVRQERNPKGIANFIKALCCLYAIAPQEEVKNEITNLSQWLLENRANDDRQFHGICWGYNFPWPNPSFYAPRNYPNAIVTCFCADALLHAHEVLADKGFIDRAVDAACFLLEDLPILEETDTSKCLGYAPLSVRMKVVNINAVIAGFLARLYQVTENPVYLDNARKMISWVISVKAKDGVWYYTDPPTCYVQGFDNYHTGGILDGIFDYMQVTGDTEHLVTYLRALKFYEEHLFEPAGAPKWRNTRTYPLDIHGAAQGILTFARASHFSPAYLDTAVRIAGWAIANMQAKDGWFYYQKRRLFTWKLELMRWNNSWMAWALADLLRRSQTNKWNVF